MINITHKLYPTKKQEQYLNELLWSSIGIENWVINQIRYELDKSYFPYRFMSDLQLRSILSKKIEGHSKKCGIPSALINCCIQSVLTSYKKHGINKLHYKSARKKNSFYLSGSGSIKFDPSGRLKLVGLKTSLKISEANKFTGRLGKCTLIKKFDSWYVSCCYDQNRPAIKIMDGLEVGIDPGLKTSLTLSDGEQLVFPKFYQQKEELIAKTSRKSRGSKKLKYIHRNLTNQRKNHHHKLSTELATWYCKIYWSDDNFKALVKRYGKQYNNLALGNFRELLKNKLASRVDGFGELILVGNRNSTKTCSSCGDLTGPSGLDGLGVREWVCSSCGATHDRDINAAINTLFLGQGMSSKKGN
jgi:transposase